MNTNNKSGSQDKNQKGQTSQSDKSKAGSTYPASSSERGVDSRIDDSESSTLSKRNSSQVEDDSADDGRDVTADSDSSFAPRAGSQQSSGNQADGSVHGAVKKDLNQKGAAQAGSQKTGQSANLNKTQEKNTKK